MKSNKNKVIIIFGPPGSGKGTQAGLLSEKLSLYYLETSKVGEERIRTAKKGDYIETAGKKYYFSDEEKLWKEGKLWSPPFVVFLMEEKIRKIIAEEKGLLLAGSPRTIYEGQKLIPLLFELFGKKNIKVIKLLLSPEQSIWRNSHRRICELMRHPIVYKPETVNLKTCPLDGSKLVRREGLDDPETIKVRLKEYKERTFPLIELFKKSGLKVIEVNGEQSVAEVFEDILKAIK
ncbi:MAG: nucleoside monophosphate kinase [Candidatus Parcubacteria bacterium]|nr:nucleoside monophosphate kinase [Candidatus Parcubacteria bacterium]